MVSYCRIENKPVVGAQLMTCSMTDANSWTEEVKEEEEKKVEVEEVEEKKVDHWGELEKKEVEEEVNAIGHWGRAELMVVATMKVGILEVRADESPRMDWWVDLGIEATTMDGTDEWVRMGVAEPFQAMLRLKIVVMR